MPEDTGSSEILSQNEVEAILASIGKAEEAPAQVVGGRARGDRLPTVSAYDFRSPSFLSPAQLRRLRIKHEDIIRSLASTCSMFLRTEFSLQMSRLETVAYRHMLDALPVPSHLTIFRLKPLPGLCLFDISPRLGLTVVDRMMGGPGHGVKVEREFTDIEKTVLGGFLDLVVREYASGWHKYQNLEYDPVESENSARFLNIVPPDEIMLYLEMEARFGDCVAGLRFILPFRSIEPLLVKMMAEITPPEAVLRRNTRLPEDPSSALHAVPVPVSLHWRGFSASLAEVNALEVGDVLLLDPRRCETAQVDLGNIPTFHARLDRRPGRLAASITGRLK